MRTGPPKPSLDQGRAAKDERTQDALPELGLGDEQCPEPLGRNDDRLHLADCRRVDGLTLGCPGELPDLRHHLARDHLRHVLERGTHHLRERRHRNGLAQGVAAGDRDPTGKDHVHPRAGSSGLEQELAGKEAADFAERPDSLDLGRERARGTSVESATPARMELAPSPWGRGCNTRPAAGRRALDRWTLKGRNPDVPPPSVTPGRR